MASNEQIIENAVKETMLEMEQRAPVQMHQLKQDHRKYQAIVQSAREAATEQVNMAKEFADEPQDILNRLQKHLPEKRIKMIQAALNLPTFRVDIESGDRHHTVHFKRKGKKFMASRKLVNIVDVDWASIMQLGSIVVEGVMFVMSAIGVSPSPSSRTIKKTTEEVAETLKNSSKFKDAVNAFIIAWHDAGGAYPKAKALFFLVKDTYAAGLLWTVLKSLCTSMSWFDWMKTAAKVTAMIIAALATDGVALIAKIALVVLSAINFAQKLANIKQLEEIKKTL